MKNGEGDNPGGQQRSRWWSATDREVKGVQVGREAQEEDRVLRNGQTITYGTPVIANTTGGVTIDDYLSMEFEGINVSTEKCITKIDIILTCEHGQGKPQEINVNLTINGVTQSKKLNFDGPKDKEIMVKFDRLNISPNDTFKITFTNVNVDNEEICITNQKVKVYLEDT